jgi:hypothetical protein
VGKIDQKYIQYQNYLMGNFVKTDGKHQPVFDSKNKNQ